MQGKTKTFKAATNLPKLFPPPSRELTQPTKTFQGENEVPSRDNRRLFRKLAADCSKDRERKKGGKNAQLPLDQDEMI